MKQKTSELRRIILDMIYKSKSSHIAVSFSIVEILTAIFENISIDKLKYQTEDRDRLIVSKGHSAAALYGILHQNNFLSENEIKSYCENNSILSGHVSHFVPYVEHSTGALGHGLPVAVGICLGLLSKGFNSAKTFVIVGDGELNEGSNWEAIMLAGNLKLQNLYLIIDKNNLAGVGSKLDEYCSIDPLDEKFKSFNFDVKNLDGHNSSLISSRIKEMSEIKKPKALICKTIKGKGVSFMENNNVWHYRPPGEDEYTKAKKEIKEKF